MKKRLFLFLICLILGLNTTKVNTLANSEFPKKYIIFIDINEMTLSLLNGESKETIKVYPIAIGKKSTPSPIGVFEVSGKALKDGPFGGYWLGLNVPWDTFGIHGTSNPGSIGSMASNGCIRMFNHNAHELFNIVDPGTPVIIYPGPNWRFSSYDRVIKPNDKGTDVYNVQRRLYDLGYYKHEPDGFYEYPLEVAVKRYKFDYGMEDNSDIDNKFLDSIGLWKID